MKVFCSYSFCFSFSTIFWKRSKNGLVDASFLQHDAFDSPPSFRSTLSSVDQLSFLRTGGLVEDSDCAVSCRGRRAGCCGLHSWLRRLACRQLRHFRLVASHSIHVLATQTTWETVTTTHFSCTIVMASCICNKHTLQKHCTWGGVSHWSLMVSVWYEMTMPVYHNHICGYSLQRQVSQTQHTMLIVYN